MQTISWLLQTFVVFLYPVSQSNDKQQGFGWQGFYPSPKFNHTANIGIFPEPTKPFR
jgi:hypothetical protein